MRIKTLGFWLGMALAASPLQPQTIPQSVDTGKPLIPPAVAKVWPVGIERGKTTTFTMDGRSLEGARAVLFDAPGLSGKVLNVTEQKEVIKAPRAGVDTAAAVPLGKKSEAQIEVTAKPDVQPGLHWFRIQTELGTSNIAVLDVGTLPEIAAEKSPDGIPQEVKLPATLVGTIETPGEVITYPFEGKAGEELVFQTVASQLGSSLRSLLVLRDAQGKVLAKAGEYDPRADAVLTYKLPADGKYSIAVSDREEGGGMDHYYRLNAGPLPYVTGVFPLGIRAGQPAEVAVTGVNLGDAKEVKVDPPKWADGWKTIPVAVKTPWGAPLNKVELIVDNQPAVLEKEPNDSPGEAELIAVPATIDGHIAGGAKQVDEDYFRFRARKGEHLTIAVAAARLRSPLDSLIEVLDAEGRPIPRATVRCLSQTSTTLSDRDSETEYFRLLSQTGLHENDYLMIGDELVQLSFIPDQPDADVVVKGMGGLRMTLLGTSPSVHPIDTPVYKAEILPADAQFPPNGLPVFHLTYRNDDGGPGYGPDSRLEFVAPKDGDYILHIRDVRGMQGADFAYRLSIHADEPDFMLTATPDHPNVPQGGSTPITVSADRLPGYQGPIEIEVKGLPSGVTASTASIPAGQDSTVIVLRASPSAPLDATTQIQILGHAKVNERDMVRVANEGQPVQVASVVPPPDLLVAADSTEVTLAPGKEVTVRLHVQRRNDFKGRVPCNVVNLPPGVRVVNVGLNGVLVHQGQDAQTFTLKAEDWAQSIEQPIYVVGMVESNSSTEHASAPLLLKVSREQVATTGTREAVSKADR